jgi:hypothetical protein
VRHSSDFIITNSFLCMAATLIASFILFGGSPPALLAAQVTLAWDPNREPDLAGYRFYQGTASGCYSAPFSLGKTTQYELKNLEPGSTYYFAITALNASGHESAFSEEVSYSVPITADETGGSNASGAPILIAPGAGSTVGLTPKLRSSNAADPDRSGRPVETRWQITRAGDGVCVLDVWSKSSLEQLTVPKGILDPQEGYCARILQVDGLGKVSEWSLHACFETEHDASDADADGVPDSQEAAGPTDIDRDGTADCLQDNIKRLALPDSENIIGIRHGPDAEITQAALMDPDSDTAEFPYGLIHLKLLTQSPGGDVSVTVLLPKPAPAGAGWQKYDPVDGTREDFSRFADFSSDRRSVTLSLSDGGIGDTDGVVNGIIIVSSGLSQPKQADASGGAGSVGGGGCFISASIVYPAGACGREMQKPTGGLLLLSGGLLLILLSYAAKADLHGLALPDILREKVLRGNVEDIGI